MSKRILFLDDSGERAHAFLVQFPMAVWARTAPEAIEALKDLMGWDEVWLDHDLGGQVFVDSRREDTGYEVVRWIIANQPGIANIRVHTWNIPAGKRMANNLSDAGYSVILAPFSVA